MHREFTVTLRERDGWIGPPVDFTDLLTLTRTVGGWRVNAIRDGQ